MFKRFFVFVCFFSFFSLSSYADSDCYDNQILDTKMLDDETVEVSFKKPINEKKKYVFSRVYCSRFYDSLICDFKSNDLPGWEISSDKHINTDWSIQNCVE